MIDALYWHIHEDLKIRLDREPTYEEVQNFIETLFKATKEQEVEFNNKKVYGEN